MFGLGESLYGGVMGWGSVLNKNRTGFLKMNQSSFQRILFFCSTKLSILSFNPLSKNLTPMSYETVPFVDP